MHCSDYFSHLSHLAYDEEFGSSVEIVQEFYKPGFERGSGLQHKQHTFSTKMHTSDDQLNDEFLTDELADEAISLIKKKLAAYIVNSFIATGYDTLDVIADLTNEDITEIEAIKNDFVGDNRS